MTPALLAPEDTTIRVKGELVSKPYIDITLNLMKNLWRGDSEPSLPTICREGRSTVSLPCRYLSRAMPRQRPIFSPAGAIKGGTVKVTDWPVKVQAIFVLPMCWEKMGATITSSDDFIACTRGELHAIDMI